jgi:hypothetical protein
VPLVFHNHKIRAALPEYFHKQFNTIRAKDDEACAWDPKSMLSRAEEMTMNDEKVAVTVDWPNSSETYLSSGRELQHEQGSLRCRETRSTKSVSLRDGGGSY